MTPFDPPTLLDESEIQFLRDNQHSETLRIVKKLIKHCYEQCEAGYMDKREHRGEDLLVLKGEKIMARGIFNQLVNAAASRPEADNIEKAHVKNRRAITSIRS